MERSRSKISYLSADPNDGFVHAEQIYEHKPDFTVDT